jgi:Dyp-type peroxidase family
MATPGAPHVIDLTDVQSLIARPTSNAHLRLTFLRATPDGLRDLLRTVGVTSAADARSGEHVVNLGLTADGLRLLGISRRAHDALPAAFTRGPADDAAPADPPLQAARPHAVLIEQAATALTGDPADELPAGVEALPPSWTGERNEDGTEPFGFRDDISNPEIEGARPGPATPGNGVWDPATGAWRKVQPGEALLGHVDESGAISGHPDAAHLERNGSYLVIRRLEQDVDGFWQACRTWAGELGWRTPAGEPDGERVAAQMVGRHRDGTLVGRGDAGNDLLYRDHRFGQVHVPPSAHIRRTNPRDDMAFAERIVGRHLLFRRGYPYADGGRTGLLFLACCADIHRQFEFVQRHWVDDGDRFGLGPERDPLVGDRDGPLHPDATKVSIDVDGQRCRRSFATFVRPRGGAYVLLPSLRALELLASDHPRP